jgi:hypothetical protein
MQVSWKSLVLFVAILAGMCSSCATKPHGFGGPRSFVSEDTLVLTSDRQGFDISGLSELLVVTIREDLRSVPGSMRKLHC